MASILRKHYVIRQNWVLILGFFFTAYFAYHLLHGERSYTRMLTLEGQTTQIEQELVTLAAQKETLENKVVMMRPGSINRDLLEERVIAVLGYTRSGETALKSEGRSHDAPLAAAQ